MNLGKTGSRGEKLAGLYLKKKGYRIIEKNFQCRFGEIDLIAESREYLIFAEVKTRKRESLVSGAESVDCAKQNRIRLTALYYLSIHPTEKQPRFDVILVVTEGAHFRVEQHIENAF